MVLLLLLLLLLLLDDPPQPIVENDTNTKSTPTIISQFRRRLGSRKKIASANAVPPAGGSNGETGEFEAVVPLMAIVRVELCCVLPLNVTDAGSILHVGLSVTFPVEETEQDKLTVPENPFVPKIWMVAVPELEPDGMVREVGFCPPPVKVGTAETVRAIAVVLLIFPEVPVTVTVTGEVLPAAELAAVKVITSVFAVVPAANEAVTPVGRPVAPKTIFPEKPPTSVTVRVVELLAPGTTETVAGEGERVKPGVKVTLTEALPVWAL